MTAVKEKLFWIINKLYIIIIFQYMIFCVSGHLRSIRPVYTGFSTGSNSSSVKTARTACLRLALPSSSCGCWSARRRRAVWRWPIRSCGRSSNGTRTSRIIRSLIFRSCSRYVGRVWNVCIWNLGAWFYVTTNNKQSLQYGDSEIMLESTISVFKATDSER